MKHSLFKRLGSATTLLAGGLLAASALTGYAGPEEKAKLAKPAVEVDPPSRVHFLFNFEFASEYVTPRGMIVRNKGMSIQPLFLTLANLYKGDGFVNDVTLVLGVWNDFGTSSLPKTGATKKPVTYWSEVDPIAGVSVGFAKNFKLDVTYTAFAEQILSIGTSQHLEVKLSADDTSVLGAFALHPYISFWQELESKATDAALPAALAVPLPASHGKHTAPGESWYVDVGIAPGFMVPDSSVKLEFPCRIQFADPRFYGEFYDKASAVALYELGVKGSMPLTFMPKGYGHWSAHLGFKYMNFVDDNLYKLETFNATGKPTRSIAQVYGGVSVFF